MRPVQMVRRVKTAVALSQGTHLSHLPPLYTPCNKRVLPRHLATCHLDTIEESGKVWYGNMP